MIELSNTNAQVIPAGQSVVFDTVLLHTGCAECYRLNSSFIGLTQRNAIYEISFNCNIGSTTAGGTAQLAITLGGAPLQETTAKTISTAAGDLENVSASTFVKTCCCAVADTILLTNTGTEDINVDAHGRLSVKRIA